jgi:hypothetical protein
MRKINFLSICLLAVTITVLSSFQANDKSSMEDYEFDTQDLVYDQKTGDFNENSIPGVDTRTGLPAQIYICPGTGERCTAWIWHDDHPTIYLAKKNPGWPSIITAQW